MDQKNNGLLRKMDSLQLFRALAALAVVVHHTVTSTEVFVGQVPGWLHSIASYGFLGVDFFFVLSGFIIMNSHFNDEKTVAALKSYGSKRFVRIFPPYWIVSITVLLSYFLLPGLSQGGRDISLLSSFFLLPAAGQPALAVAWTLIHEVMFYLIFCLFFFSTRLFVLFVAGWVLAILAAGAFATDAELSPFLKRFLDPVNLEFVMGMATAYLARRVKNRSGFAWILAGAAVLALIVLWPALLQSRAMYGIPFAMMVLGAVSLERARALIFPRFMVLLGDASYSIYLVHDPLVALTSRVVARVDSLSSWEVGLAAGIAGSIVAGIVYHMAVEKPLIRVFRRGDRRKPVAGVPVETGVQRS